MQRIEGQERIRSNHKPSAAYGNYRYSLTQEEQADCQIFLRSLINGFPAIADNPTWNLLIRLTYTDSWSDKPEAPLVDLDD